MASRFVVSTTARFERLFRSLEKGHPDLRSLRDEMTAVLEADPQNRSRVHPIRELVGVKPGEGQYRLRIGRWRFRYDIYGRDVVLHSCALRDERTYR